MKYVFKEKSSTNWKLGIPHNSYCLECVNSITCLFWNQQSPRLPKSAKGFSRISIKRVSGVISSSLWPGTVPGEPNAVFYTGRFSNSYNNAVVDKTVKKHLVKIYKFDCHRDTLKTHPPTPPPHRCWSAAENKAGSLFGLQSNIESVGEGREWRFATLQVVFSLS